MPRTIDAPPPPVHWARRHSKEIGVGLIVIAILLIGTAIYVAATSQAKVVARPPTAFSTPAPTPNPTPLHIFNYPIVSDSGIALKGIRLSIAQFRIINDYTAVTFDMKAQSAHSVNLIRQPHNDTLQNTHIIDDAGKRYQLLYDTSSGTDNINWNQNGTYRMERGESISFTYFFQKMPQTAKSAKLFFSLLNSAPSDESPYFDIAFKSPENEPSGWVVEIPALGQDATYSFGGREVRAGSDDVTTAKLTMQMRESIRQTMGISFKLVSVGSIPCRVPQDVHVIIDDHNKVFRAVVIPDVMVSGCRAGTIQ